jgi:large subunit ribosomal protein L4
MLEIPVYNTNGEQARTLQLDESLFGGEVNVDLVKQAVVAYQATRRQGTVRTKTRSDIVATTKKMYRQKGTGRARHGAATVNLMRGGGMAFAKRPRPFDKRLPKKMRKAALASAILAKMIGGDFCVVEGLSLDQPRTRVMADLLKALGINRRCLLATASRDTNVYLSSRNLPDMTVRSVDELNAFDVATRPKMIVTAEAMDALAGQEANA